MERAARVVVLLAIVLLALSACGEEAERGHDEPSPHGRGPTAAAPLGAPTGAAP